MQAWWSGRSAVLAGALCVCFGASRCVSDADGDGARQALQAHRIDGMTVSEFNPPPAESSNITLVGQQSFGGRGNFGDVWVHGDYAYIGGYRDPHCPGDPVNIADVSNPTRPTAVASFAGHAHTSAEDVEVFEVNSAAFQGTVAAVGLQDCSETRGVYGMRGLELWDTTNPRRPTRLGFLSTSDLPEGGVHELNAFTRGGRYYVAVASNFFAVEGTDSPGPVRIIDVTNPRAPTLVSGWHIGRDAGLAYGSPLFSNRPPYNCSAPRGGTSDCRMATSGGYPVVTPHSVSVNGTATRLYVSYWDAGMVILDIRDMAHPRMIGRGNSTAAEEGDMHSSLEVPYFGGNIALTTDEDFSPVFNLESVPSDIWGYVRVWDLSNPAVPRQIAAITSPHSASARTDGFYAVHNPVAWRNLAFFSWYTDGVRVYDLATPSSPQLLGFFDAPRVPPPESMRGGLPVGAIWGVYVRPPYIYASDMNAGLYVLQMNGAIMSHARP